MKNEYMEWLKFADDDILTAEVMSKIGTPPVEIVCYHCQQAAEKLLKAFLIKNKEPVIKTHDLVFLNSGCIKFDSTFVEINKECIRLTSYGVNARYPGILDINEEDMGIAINDAIKIRDFIRDRLS